MTRPPQRVVLHVGLPKTGTTYLQALLAHHRDALREAGVLYPFVKPQAMFLGAVEVRGSREKFGLTEADVAGTWQALCDRARSHEGTSVISHEILGGADPDEIAAALSPLAGLDVDVVVTARDLGRQATAHWQEEVKLGDTRSFADLEREQYRADVPDGPGERPHFWHAQDHAAALRRWSTVVPATRVHLVTCPPPGAAADVLWRRFAEAAAIPPDALDPRETDSASGANRSLGAAQVRLLREVLVALEGRVGQPDHAHVVKRRFAQQTLAARAGAPARPTPELAAYLAERSAGWAQAIEQRGWLVHGDLADLAVQEPEPGEHPDEVPADDLGTPEDLASMLLDEVGQRHEQPEGLLGRISRRVRRGRRQPRTPRRSPGA